MGTVRVIKVGMACLVVLVAAGRAGGAGGPQGRATVVSAPGASPKRVTVVALSLTPEGSLEAAAAGEILAASLLEAGVKVLSSDLLVRTRETMLRKAEEQAEDADKAEGGRDKGSGRRPAGATTTRPSRKADTPLIDGLAVAKEAGADCVVKVTILVQAVQQNIYDRDNRRVMEVRTETRVSLLTTSILSTNGDLIKVGALVYAEAVPVAVAAVELGRAIAQQIAPKK